MFYDISPLLDVKVAEEGANRLGCLFSVIIDLVIVTELGCTVKRLKASSACRSDNIPALLIKDYLSALEVPLLHV